MAVFVANADCVDHDPNDRTEFCVGTKIHITGAPMAGFCHEWQRKYNCSGDGNLESASKLASIGSKYVIDLPRTVFSTDRVTLGKDMLHDLTLKVPATPPSKDYLNPEKPVRAKLGETDICLLTA